MLMARRLRVGSAQNVVIVAHAVRARVAANIPLIKSVHSIRIAHAARVVKAAIIKAINLPS
jgi:hypothetical protein